MKTLLLLRHAKSDWSHEGQRDHDRTLNPRGRRDAPRMGKLLRAEKLIPDLVLSSTAKRARKTAEKVVAGGKLTAPIQQLESFYLAPPKAYIEAFQQQHDDVVCLLAVGHNPGIEELSQILTGQAEPFATGTLAHIELKIERWSDMSLKTPAILRNLWRPRELDG